MARADKVAAVAELTESFSTSTAALLTEYRGLTVAELKELRRSLAGNATYAVVKNTLSTIAARQAGLESITSLLQGPSAIAFVSGDPVEAAKSLRAFSREHPMLVVKGGIFEGKTLTADEVRALADLESREVLLAKLAGGMKASLSQAVGLFAAPLSQAARLMAALAAKAEADPSVLRGGDGASAADPTPAATDTAATDTPATDTADTDAADVAPVDTDSAAADSTESEAAEQPAAATETATPEPAQPETSSSDDSEPTDPVVG